MNFRKLKNIDEICVGDTMDYLFKDKRSSGYIQFKVLKIEKDKNNKIVIFDFDKSVKNKGCHWERGYLHIYDSTDNNTRFFRIKKNNFKHINYNFLND